MVKASTVANTAVVAPIKAASPLKDSTILDKKANKLDLVVLSHLNVAQLLLQIHCHQDTDGK